MIRYLLTAVALAWIFPLFLQGQFYNTGENPGKIKWLYITTDNFKIIYPSGLTDDAMRLADKLEFSLSHDADMHYPPRKRFPVVMQNGSIISNGFVALAPSRMELQITPPQDSYAQDWISQLSLHEFRHVTQLNKLNLGTTRVLSWVSGEIARGVVSSQVPAWFYEGDAVYNETKLSHTGRGRSAGFIMPLRTLLIDKDKNYSFNKAVFGSYRDYVPDQYIYGYHLTNYLRTQYGSESWAHALEYVARNPYLIWPLSIYLKRNYNFNKAGLYNRTVDSLKIYYNENVIGLKSGSTLSTAGRSAKVYTSYQHPMSYNGSIIAYRSGLNDPGSFVSIDSFGREKKITTIGPTVMVKTDMYDSKFVWEEIVSDPRWAKRDFSVVKEFDLATGKKRNITRKSRYFSPDYSPDGTMIAVAENDENNGNYITIIDAADGRVVRKINTGTKAVVTPEWSGMNDIIVITVSSAGKQLESVNLSSGEWTIHIPSTTNNILDPVDYGNYIILRADFNGVENLVAFEKTTGNIFQVTNAVFGARNPFISGERLLFSEYTAKGFRISVLEANPEKWKAIDTLMLKSLETETKEIVATSPLPYNKMSHLFRFHSWLPFYTDIKSLREDPLGTDLFPGFIVLSQNTLGTSIASVGYSYEEGYHYFHPSLIWRGWYPVIELSADAGIPRRNSSVEDGSVIVNTGPDVTFRFRTYVPLRFSHGSFTTFFRPEIEYDYSTIWNNRNELSKGIDMLHLRFMTSNYLRMSIRDIYPVWGQSFTSTFSFQPSARYYGNLYSLRLTMFFPGIFMNHHFFFSAGYQKQNAGDFLLPYTRVSFPRGYNAMISRTFSSLMLNYSFPVAYPDLSFGPVLYIKRLRSNLFYDTGWGKDFTPEPETDLSDMRSLGTEIMADFHALRLIFPLSAGIRIGYKVSDKNVFAEFLMQINTNL